MKIHCLCGEAYDINLPFGHQILDVRYALTDDPLPENQKTLKNERGEEHCKKCHKRTVYVYGKGTSTGPDVLKPHPIEKLINKLSFSYWVFRPLICLLLGFTLTTLPMCLIPIIKGYPDVITRDYYIFAGFQAGLIFLFFHHFWFWMREDFGEIEEHVKKKKFKRILVALNLAYSPFIFFILTSKIAILMYYFTFHFSTLSQFPKNDAEALRFHEFSGLGWNVLIAITIQTFVGYLAAILRLCFSKGIFIGEEKYENIKIKMDRIFQKGNAFFVMIFFMLILRNYTQLPFLQTQTLVRVNGVLTPYGFLNFILLPFSFLLLGYVAFALAKTKLLLEVKRVYHQDKIHETKTYTLEIMPMQGGSRLHLITDLAKMSPTVKILNKKKNLNKEFKEKFLDVIKAALDYSSLRGGSVPRKKGIVNTGNEFHEKISDLGEELYTVYFKKDSDFNYHFKQCLEKHIPTLYIEAMEEDASIPWELVRVKDDFLCILANTVRVLSTFPKEMEMPIQGGALIVGANPKRNKQELKKVEDECETVRKIFEEADIEVTVLLNQDATRENFKEALKSQKYQFLHFSGHSKLDEAKPHHSMLYLEDDDLKIFEIAGTLSNLERKPALVFLNSCESSAQEYKKGRIQGLADGFLKSGVLYVVGMQWEVGEAGIVKLASTFYKELLNKKLPEEALRLARYEAGYETKFIDPIWASPVIYRA